MRAKDKLITPGAEHFMAKHKEEIAEEFGIQASRTNPEGLTGTILDEWDDKEEKVRTNEDMV